MSRYRRPAAESRFELRDTGSRFFAFVFPARGSEQVERCLAGITARHRDATHVCFAWRLGDPPRERASDAGEPAGTAGRPMLTVLRGAELSDVLVVVVRYFGGTKLGRGGLARAYAAAVEGALEGLPAEEVFTSRPVRVRFAYDRLGAMRRLLAPPEVTLAAESYGADIEWTLAVDEERLPALRAALAELAVSVAASRADASS